MAAGMDRENRPTWGALGYMEEESRSVFQNGDALFMRNWPYAYTLAEDRSSAIRGKVGVMPLPASDDGTSVSTMGGWHWAISAYTKNPQAAIALLKIVSSAESQKKALALMGWAPSRTALYDDPEVLAQAPYLADFKNIFLLAKPRPATQTSASTRRSPKRFITPPTTCCAVTLMGRPRWPELQQRLERIKARGWR